MRERLWSVAARRATAAVIRRSRTGGLARRLAGWLVDADGPMPEPRLKEQMAVALADRLPGGVVSVLGVRGMRVLAAVLALPLRIAGRVVGIGPMGSEGRA